MRVALGRIALLLGVVVVGAMAWYGATSLFAEDEDDPSSADRDCAAVASRSAASDARRDFVRRYGDARWFRAVEIKRTTDGFVLRVTYRTARRPDALPDCQSTVPVVAVRGRSTAA
jgi:hypothetical protein